MCDSAGADWSLVRRGRPGGVVGLGVDEWSVVVLESVRLESEFDSPLRTGA